MQILYHQNLLLQTLINLVKTDFPLYQCWVLITGDVSVKLSEAHGSQIFKSRRNCHLMSNTGYQPRFNIFHISQTDTFPGTGSLNWQNIWNENFKNFFSFLQLKNKSNWFIHYKKRSLLQEKFMVVNLSVPDLLFFDSTNMYFFCLQSKWHKPSGTLFISKISSWDEAFLGH